MCASGDPCQRSRTQLPPNGTHRRDRPLTRRDLCRPAPRRDDDLIRGPRRTVLGFDDEPAGLRPARRSPGARLRSARRAGEPPRPARRSARPRRRSRAAESKCAADRIRQSWLQAFTSDGSSQRMTSRVGTCCRDLSETIGAGLVRRHFERAAAPILDRNAGFVGHLLRRTGRTSPATGRSGRRAGRGRALRYREPEHPLTPAWHLRQRRELRRSGPSHPAAPAHGPSHSR